MVNLVEDWADIEDYAQRCRYGSYQTRDTVDGTEIHVHVGKFGYIHVFEDHEDQQLQRIIKFCKAEAFIKILGNIPDDWIKANQPDSITGQYGGLPVLLLNSPNVGLPRLLGIHPL